MFVLFKRSEGRSAEKYLASFKSGRVSSTNELAGALTFPTLRSAYEFLTCGQCENCKSGRRAACPNMPEAAREYRAGSRSLA